jgi:hypothetical protein
MAVLMVDVRKVRVPMPQGLMAVLVNVGLTALPVRLVLMLMMRIV